MPRPRGQEEPAHCVGSPAHRPRSGVLRDDGTGLRRTAIPPVALRRTRGHRPRCEGAGSVRSRGQGIDRWAPARAAGAEPVGVSRPAIIVGAGPDPAQGVDGGGDATRIGMGAAANRSRAGRSRDARRSQSYPRESRLGTLAGRTIRGASCGSCATTGGPPSSRGRRPRSSRRISIEAPERNIGASERPARTLNHVSRASISAARGLVVLALSMGREHDPSARRSCPRGTGVPSPLMPLKRSTTAGRRGDTRRGRPRCRRSGWVGEAFFTPDR